MTGSPNSTASDMTPASGKAGGGVEQYPLLAKLTSKVRVSPDDSRALILEAGNCYLENQNLWTILEETEFKLKCALEALDRLTAATPAANGPGEAVNDGELWSWLKRVMEQGASIHQDYMAGKHNGYKQYSAHMDAAASKRTDELIAMLPSAASNPQPGMVTVPSQVEEVCRRAIGSIGSYDRGLQQHYQTMLDVALTGGKGAAHD